MCLGYLLNSNMRRSWPRYIFVTSKGTGSILPCLALFTQRVFSSKVVSWVCMSGMCVGFGMLLV